MKNSKLVITFLSIGMLTVGAFGQDGDNTAFGIAWADSDTTTFENHYQGDVAGPFDFDGDGNDEFITLLCDARFNPGVENLDPEKTAVLALVEENSAGDDYAIVWSYRWAPITDFAYGNGQRGLAVGDLDGDTNLEIVVGLEAGVGLPDIWIFEASSAGVFPDYPTATIFADQIGLAGTIKDEGRWSFEPTSLIADLDDDGKEEYVSAAASGLAIIELAGGTFTADPIWDVEYLNTTDFIKSWSITLTDLDQDGTPELCYASVGAALDWSRPRFLILESTGSDAYAIVADVDGSKLPSEFVGNNGPLVEANFDGDTDNELYIVGIDGKVWVVDTGGDLSSVTDSSSFYLLHSFPGKSWWWIGDMVTGNLDGTDGGDIYIAGGAAGAVWDVEYVSGDVTEDISYAYYTMVDTSDAGQPSLGFNPQRLALVGDNLVVVSVNHKTGDPTVYVVGWGAGPGIRGEAGSELPYEYALKSNYPNPFNPATVIQYDLRESGNVSIQIYNLKGQLVRTLVNGYKDGGSYQTIWNGKSDYNKSVSTGVYITVMMAGDFKASTKITLLK